MFTEADAEAADEELRRELLTSGTEEFGKQRQLRIWQREKRTERQMQGVTPDDYFQKLKNYHVVITEYKGRPRFGDWFITKGIELLAQLPEGFLHRIGVPFTKNQAKEMLLVLIKYGKENGLLDPDRPYFDDELEFTRPGTGDESETVEDGT